MKELKLVILTTAVIVGSLPNTVFAAPGNAMDKMGLQDGAVSLTVLSEAGSGSGWIHTIANAVEYNYNATWGQPKLQLVQGSNTFQGFGMCIDSARTVALNTIYSYTVGGYAANTPTIEDNMAWNKLTYMWSQASVSSNSDRAALQLATWKGCAGDWNSARTDFWKTYDGVSYGFRLDGDPGTLMAQANAYLAYGNTYTGTNEVAGFKLITDGHQNFAAAVPEPGSILAALTILAPAGMLFRRRK